MNIQFHDVKDILKKVKQGGGGNYTPLEIELAKMAYRYRCKIAEKADEVSHLQDELFRIYNNVVSTKSVGEMMHRRASILDSSSKAHFAAAVRLDGELKEMMDGIGKEDKEKL